MILLKYKKAALLSYALLNIFFIKASNIDSLQLRYNAAVSDTAKINILLEIGDFYEHSIPDSALYYYETAYNNALNSNEEDVALKKQKGEALRNKGIVNRKTGDFTKANSQLQSSLDLFYEIDCKDGISKTYSSLGVLNRNMGNNKNALEYYQQALDIYLEIDDEGGVSAAYNNIGIIHNIEENYELAIEYFEKAYESFRMQGNKLREGIALMNMGNAFLLTEEYQEALKHYDKSMEMFLSLNNQRGVAQLNNNKAIVFVRKENFEKGLEFFKKSLESHEALGDLKGKAATYNNIADLYYKMNNYSESIKNAEKALEISSNINSLDHEVKAYNHLRRAHMELDQNYWASYYADLHISKKDSLHSIEISKAIAELETRYQSERNQLEIENLQQENRLKEAELSLKNRLLITITISLIIFMFLSFIIYYQYTAKKKANYLLTKKNADIQKKNEKITKQRNNIESSIKYAQSIQKALLPGKTGFDRFFKDTFILEQPSDIVSGDFYWTYQINNNKIIFAVADSTGHGVPGAFMSVLGITLLNDIIIKDKEYRLDEILKLLRSGFITALHQNDPNSIHNEDVEISICLYDKSKKELHFAAANNQILILKKNNKQSTNTDKKATPNSHYTNKTFKGDRLPIGLHKKNENFTIQKIPIDESCKAMYLYTDGFYNQINPETQKRYTSNRFKNKFVEIGHLPMQEQLEVLQNEFLKWKNNGMQTDDLTVVGVKF